MTTPPSAAGSLRQQQLLLLAVCVTVAPHAANLAPGVMLFFAVLAAWRCATLYRPAWRLGRVPLMALAALGVALVLTRYHHLHGREAGTSLLVIGLGLKLHELRTARDVSVTVYLSLFLLVTLYLFSQTIPLAVYTVVAAGLLLAVLAGAGPGAAAGPAGQLALAGRLMLQALPVTAILFVLFPRIPGPLWNLPDPEQQKRLGLGDVVEIGSVTALRLSPDVAFRVDFQGRVPPPADRYWRGPVFSRFDGHRWTQLPGVARMAALRTPRVNGEPYRQTITLEPTNRRWVFALDIPGPPAAELVQTRGYNLAARHELRERSRHVVESYADYRLEAASSGELMHSLALPDEPSPRVQALVEEWRARSPEPLDIARAALHHFRTGDFLYTLDVDPIEGDVVDIFLFETRKGFCEHYATAFITLMRVAGIPARLVTGYKGGAWNPVGKFLEVRQYDAHGWAEIHLEDRGWVRIDPTAAVTSASIDPELAEQWRRADTESQSQDQDQGEDGAAANRSAADRALDWMKMAWASTDHAWNRWVLSYTPEAQQQFWQQLRTHDWRSTMFWAGALSTVLGTAAALLLAPRLGLRLDPAVAHYRRFLRRLARHGVIRRPAEGPLDFARRAAAERPEAAAAIDRITELFLRLRYGRSPQRADLGELRRRVSRFRA